MNIFTKDNNNLFFVLEKSQTNPKISDKFFFLFITYYHSQLTLNSERHVFVDIKVVLDVLHFSCELQSHPATIYNQPYLSQAQSGT